MPPDPRKSTLPNLRLPTAAVPARPGGAALPQAGIVTRERRAQNILANIENLPSLPAVVMDVLRLANSPSSSAYDFDVHFRKDQALAARMLKLVNSSFFGLPNKVSSISRAIVILGYKTLKSVVMAASTSPYLDRNLAVYGFASGGLWMHSLATAGTARHFGMKILKTDPDTAEELFVAGLLHDIGKIVVGPVLRDSAAEWQRLLAAKPGAAVSELEMEITGLTHAQAGAKLMAKWNLPARLGTAIEAHHDTPNPGNAADGQFGNVIRLANQVTMNMRLGLAETYSWPMDVNPALLAVFGMNEADLPALQADLQKLMTDMQPLFESMRRESR